LASNSSALTTPLSRSSPSFRSWSRTSVRASRCCVGGEAIGMGEPSADGRGEPRAGRLSLSAAYLAVPDGGRAFRRESRSPANGGGPELGSLAPHGGRGCHRGSHSSRSGRIRPCRQAAQDADAGSWRSVRDPLPRSAREARTPTPRGSRLAPWRGCREASRGSLAASHRVGRPGRREPPPLAKPSGAP
jgi:hypothetical protein